MAAASASEIPKFSLSNRSTPRKKAAFRRRFAIASPNVAESSSVHLENGISDTKSAPHAREELTLDN
eukprot:scaffold156177_cov31-Tisochrysis_lutea.AAC.3